MVTIIFEAHGTTLDNEAHLASGIYDVELSELGKQQAKELGERYKNNSFDAIFCSGLQRSYKTAEIAFANRNLTIIKDARLNECDYGDLTRHPSIEVDAEKPKHITKPFPGGESFEQTSERMKKFLKDLLSKYDGKKVMIIGHRATQYALEHWIKGVPLTDAIKAAWEWQPGWIYYREKI